MKEKLFTSYQIFVIVIIALLQFTVVLDFMVLSPLGAQLMQELKLTTTQFSYVVSVYAFSAGTAGLIAAGFSDNFDRKKLLLLFYSGFITGTLLCGISNTFYTLFFARSVTGIFGGIIGAVSLAIVADLFSVEKRGRVMGFVQMAYALSQVLGIPAGLLLANNWGWHAPFLLIAGLGVPLGFIILIYLQPINQHLEKTTTIKPWQHFVKVGSNKLYLKAFGTVTLLATAVYMLQPFSSAYMVNNLGISLTKLPQIYVITGLGAILSAPFIGKLTDYVGKYKVFFLGTVLCILTIYIYCNLGRSTITFVTFISALLIVGILMRMISSSALLSAVPSVVDRGAFMSMSSSLQQFSGGIATLLAGAIVVQNSNGSLRNYPLLGLIIIITMAATLWGLYVINKEIQKESVSENNRYSRNETHTSLAE